MIDPLQPGSSSDTVRATEALRRLKSQCATIHAVPVFQLTAAEVPGGVVLTGKVLTERQRRRALDAVKERVEGEVTDRIEVLTRSEAVSWIEPRRAHADVLDAPSGRLTTQLAEGDPPARVLLRHGEFTAVELADGTVGWCAQRDWRPTARAPRGVADWRREWQGGPGQAGAREWRMTATSWVGVPYLWGGTTRAGVDCSGLTQRVYKEVLGVGLPRHSLDQMRSGRRASPQERRPGDLLVLEHLASSVSHVATVIGSEPAEVAHACRDRGEVVLEAEEELFGRYRFRAARRFTREPSA